jgi:hypothetical protein
LNFFPSLRTVIDAIPPELIFGTHESMIDQIRIHKTAVKGGKAVSMEELDDHIQLVTIMFAHSPADATRPPIVTSPERQQAPMDMGNIITSFKGWIGSMTKRTDYQRSSTVRLRIF